jgi:hypothetical protein
MLRGITSTELQFLGMTQVTYAKPVLLASGNVGYAIHAADGTELAVVDDLATAAELVGARDLTLLPVH